MRISDWSSDVCSSDLRRRRADGGAAGCEAGRRQGVGDRPAQCRRRRGPGPFRGAGGRSEEHTSELQSLMRISYAVFCLKKKTTITNTIKHQHTKSQDTQHLTQHKLTTPQLSIKST